MTRLVLFCFAAVLCGWVPRAAAGDGADLTAYIESIRASGMSENAQSMVYSVASILSGATLLTFPVDAESGRYWSSYQSATCPNPKADPPELTQWKKVKVDETSAMITKLKPFADADNSGFVTTEEGSDFRFLLEFGYMADQAIHDKGTSVDVVARAYGQDLAATEARLRKYAAMQKRIAQAGVTGLPEIPIAGLTDG